MATPEEIRSIALPKQDLQSTSRTGNGETHTAWCSGDIPAGDRRATGRAK